MFTLKTAVHWGLMASIGVAAPASAAVSFSDLGPFSGDYLNVHATALSADGKVVVGYAGNPVGTASQAFLWTQAGGFQSLGHFSSGGTISGSAAHAVSSDGSVIVGFGSHSNGSEEAFRWTSGTGMVGIGDLPGSRFESRAHGVSADGSVVVGRSASSTGDEAFRWTTISGMTGLGKVSSGTSPIVSHAWDVSADGEIVIGTVSVQDGTSTRSEPFRWTEDAAMTSLGDLPGGPGLYGGSARAISGDGTVITGYSESDVGTAELFRWTVDDGLVGLGFTGNPYATSHDGSVIVGETGSGAFIWDETHGLRLIDQLLSDAGIAHSGFRLAAATGVSADGLTISGFGYKDIGGGHYYEQSWVLSLSPVPEPKIAETLAAGLLLVGYSYTRTLKSRGKSRRP